MAVDGKGDVLIARSPTSSSGDLTAAKLVIRNLRDQTELLVPTPSHKSPQQVISAAMDTDWVVWMETTSDGVDVQPWTLYAFDRRSRRSTTLAHSQLIDGQEPPPPPGFTGPTLTNGRVFWAQVGGSMGAEEVDVLGCTIAACKPETFAAGSAFPSASANDLYVVTAPRYAGDRDAANHLTIRQVDLQTRQDSIVAESDLGPDETPGGLAVSGRNAVWLVSGHPSTAVYRDIQTSTTSSVVSETEGMFGYPVATDIAVSWAESSGSAAANVGGYTLASDSLTLSTLGNTAGLYNILANGKVLTWQTSSTPAARPRDITTVVAYLN